MSCRSARLVSRMRAILASWITGQPCLSELLNSRDLAIMPRSPTSRSSCKRRAILSPKSLEGPFLGNCKLYSAGRNYDDPAPAADERGVWPQNASQIRPSARASSKRAFASEARARQPWADLSARIAPWTEPFSQRQRSGGHSCGLCRTAECDVGGRGSPLLRSARSGSIAVTIPSSAIGSPMIELIA
jgi:hypothetical protein